MKAGGRKKLAAVIACAGSMLLAFTSALSPMTSIAYAAAPSEFDKTAIEEDLKVFELEGYPKNEEEKHRLIDGGFMEYAYSENAELSGKYYGVYFYVYNPTEREVSERAGAHTVNMAVAYDAAGEPSDYDNLALTFLDETENHRFLKFKLTDGAGAYARAKAYAQAHGGERRYDVAGVQLWFAGDQNATDSKAGKDISYTFRCTGYAAGCGVDPEAASTYECNAEKLETVELSVNSTVYRMERDRGVYSQLDTVYFSVPKYCFEMYGKLQRIKAEWYEYFTRPIFVIKDKELEKDLTAILGNRPPKEFNINNYESFMEEMILLRTHDPNPPDYPIQENIPKDMLLTEFSFMGVNYIFGVEDISSYDPRKDLVSQGGVDSNRLYQYMENYNSSFHDGRLKIKEKEISADLFYTDIPESRKVDNERGKVQYGYSYYDFDADTDLQTLVSWQDGNPSFWDNWLTYGFFNTILNRIPQEEGRTVSPIEIIDDEKLSGTNEEISKRLLIDISSVEKIKEAYESEKGQKEVVLFHFATSDYYVSDIFATGNGGGRFYVANESVFLNFDIIQLTFKRGDKLKVIPIVANPIDVIAPIVPSYSHNTRGIPWWIWCAAAGAILTLGLVITIMAEKEARK